MIVEWIRSAEMGERTITGGTGTPESAASGSTAP